MRATAMALVGLVVFVVAALVGGASVRARAACNNTSSAYVAQSSSLVEPSGICTDQYENETTCMSKDVVPAHNEPCEEGATTADVCCYNQVERVVHYPWACSAGGPCAFGPPQRGRRPS